MADYGLSSRTLGDVKEALTGEGLGVALGLIGAGFVGRQIQNRVKTDAEVTAAPTITNYAYAWGGNNIPKLAIWYLMRDRAHSELMVDAKKAVAGSVVFDSIMRLFNGGTNPATASVGGYEVLGNGRGMQAAGGSGDVQKVIQENSALRNELSNALQRLAEAGISVSLPDGSDRRRRFSHMDEGVLQTPAHARQKRFSIMGDSGLTDLTARFGML
jgi:hypothetical protein